jgi:hypothetical protein
VPTDRTQKLLLVMLSSTHSGEVIAAREALQKNLKENGTDIHALVDRTGGISEEDMKLLFDAGYKKGCADTESKQVVSSVYFNNIDGSPNWEEMAKFCQQRNDKLTKENERKFVADVASQAVWGREFTPRQKNWLLSIFYKLGGKL